MIFIKRRTVLFFFTVFASNSSNPYAAKNDHKSLLRSSQGEVLEADASPSRRKLEDIIMMPPEGYSIRCLQEPDLVHRFAEGELHLYPNGLIASSWNANWREDLVDIDCSGIPTGTPMSMNFDALQMARSKEWSTTTDEDQDICEVVQKAADICNTCRSPQEPLTKDPSPSPPSQPKGLLSLGHYNNCVIDEYNGEVHCWEGRIHYDINTLMAFPSNPMYIACGTTHTCMIMQSHELKCWGSNYNGQLGLGHTDHVDTPTTVTDAHGRRNSGAIQVALGSRHSCIIANNKNVYCWGYNDSDEDLLGVGSKEEYVTTPTAVQLDGGIGIGAIQIAAGYMHTCVIDTNNNVQCWGDHNTPLTIVALEGGVGAVQIATSDYQTCLIDTSGSVQCWRSYDPNPKIVWLGEGILATQVGVGRDHVCVLVNDAINPLKCWGHNGSGQLGDGTVIDLNDHSGSLHYDHGLTNVVLEGVEGVITELKSGSNHNCIVVADDDAKKVFCWGLEHGDDGDGTTNTYISRPELVLTMKKD